MNVSYGRCTCNESKAWCWGCGHTRRHCSRDCRKNNLHGRCEPINNSAYLAQIQGKGR